MRNRWMKRMVLMSFVSVLATACGAVGVTGSGYALTLDDRTGDLASFRSGGREWIQTPNRPRALFHFVLRDKNTGARRDLTALDGARPEITVSGSGDARCVSLVFRTLGGVTGLDARVTARCPERGTMTYWRFALENPTGDLLDFVDFPVIVTPDRLRGSGGDETLFWPGLDGAEVEDSSNPHYQPIEYPTHGIQGIYPGSCPMQFMAVYGPDAGLYAATHDASGTPKGIEYRRHAAGGLALEFRHFPGVAQARRMELPYETVLGGFSGGSWYGAADIYRDWLEHSGMNRGAKLEDNPRVPGWLKDAAPIVVTYPVRAQTDSDTNFAPNCYYPYTAALPVLEDIARDAESPVLALLMHWEGTAPWAPPYVWPPYGGTNDFLAFVRALHAKGNLAGVYASGVAYTTQSYREKNYNRYTEFAKERVFNYVTGAPEGGPALNGACVGWIRDGYDLCPACGWVRDRVVKEIKKVLPSGVDYFQYFDQNMGGAPCWCYARNHGHPPAPGPWMTDAMNALYRDAQRAGDDAGRRVMFGTEASASEVFIPYLMMNDARNFLAFMRGTPVPAYAYVNHEYQNNFMGNQVTTQVLIDFARSPLNYLWRLAYSFAQGDVPTVILGSPGQFVWAWGLTWAQPTRPDRGETLRLARNLNRWRRGAAKPYVVFGRMLRPWPLSECAKVDIYRPDVKAPMKFDALLACRYEHGGKTGQIVVNYTPQPQTAVLTGLPAAVQIRTDASGTAAGVRHETAAGTLKITVPPLDAVLVESADR